MNIQHFEKGLTFNDRELLFVARRIGKLATYCKRVKDEASKIKVEVEGRKTKKQRDMLKMSVTLDLPRKTLRAESRKASVIECIDRCIEKLEPQVKKYKQVHSKKWWKRSK